MAGRLSNIIPDGQTLDGYLAEVEGVSTAVTFQYRPMLPQVSEAFVDLRYLDQTPDHRITALCQALEMHLVSWSEKEPPTCAVLRRTRRTVLHRLLNIVGGFGPSDPLPGAQAAKEPAEDANALLASMIGGGPIGQIKDAKLVKNSG